eukprot:m.9475 g.9475  ORF g.9475 m.9475 type:complete len:1095 (-) comp6919_c0_seq1:465-3749(-)
MEPFACESMPAQRDPPESMVCPITHQLMIDPVMDPDGYSYERSAITKWIFAKHTSPVTRKGLSVQNLKPNRALAQAISEHRERELSYVREHFENQITTEGSSGSNESNGNSSRNHVASPTVFPPGLEVQRHVQSTNAFFGRAWSSTDQIVQRRGGRQQAYSINESSMCNTGHGAAREGCNIRSGASPSVASTHDTDEASASSLRVAARAASHFPLGLSVQFVNGECCGEAADVLVGHVTVVAPGEASRETRAPMDMCFVLDTSGSMNAEARLKVGNETEEGDDLSLLDVVRHGVRTVVGVLEPCDRVAVVKYSSTATIVHRLLPMNASGKSVSEDQIQQLRPAGTTNLWEGLCLGLDVLREEKVPGRTQCLMLLTDGVPNVEPPRGHIPMLQRYLRRYPAMRACTINTFGFGYDLDSDLLRQIAFTGLGTYNFIPDVGFVGTAFIHAVSNALTVVAKNVQIEVVPEDPAVRLSAKNVCGGFCVTPGVSSGALGITISIGSVCFEQNRDICIKVPRTGHVPRISVGGVYTDAGSDEHSVFASVTPTAVVNATTETIFHCCRIATAVELLKCAQMPSYRCSTDTLAPRIESLLEYIERLAPDGGDDEDSMLSGLVRDLTGQVREAVSRMDWYNRWGRHYFPSLMFAHLMQQCNNFKDPGVQGYGGTMFKDIRDDADDLFCGLPHPVSTRQAMPRSPGAPEPWGSPPPTPVQFPSAFYVPPNPCQVPAGHGGRDTGGVHTGRGRVGRYPSREVSMARYNCRSAPCFAGHCRVAVPVPAATMGTLQHQRRGCRQRARHCVPIASLRRGDKVLTPDGGEATVKCLVVTRVSRHSTFFVSFPGGLLVTPYHPVRVPLGCKDKAEGRCAKTTWSGRWCMPQSLYPVHEYGGCNAVYNVVLDRGHVLTINGIDCITLAHGITNHEVLSHPYLGTTRIVDDLANCPGWKEGRVVIADMLRDPVTSLLCGLRPCTSPEPIHPELESIYAFGDTPWQRGRESQHPTPGVCCSRYPREYRCCIADRSNLASSYSDRYNGGRHNWSTKHQNSNHGCRRGHDMDPDASDYTPTTLMHDGRNSARPRRSSRILQCTQFPAPMIQQDTAL